MVEELKIAIKVDDDTIEQSLLKQFNNAEKMADKVVFRFKNINFDDKNIEKEIRNLQKMVGNNPIELPIDTEQSLKILRVFWKEFEHFYDIINGKSLLGDSAKKSTKDINEEAKAFDKAGKAAKSSAKGKEEFDKANKKVREGAKSSTKAISEEASEFNKIIGKLDGYNAKLKKFEVKPADNNRYPIYQENINELTDKIHKLQELSIKDIDLINANDVEDAKNLQKEIDRLIFKMNNMSAGEKGFDPLSADKALEKINSELQKNSAMSKEAKLQIKALYNEIRSGNPSKPIKDLLDDMYKLIQLEREAGRAGKSFMDIISEKRLYGIAAEIGTMFSFYDLINAGRQVVENVKEIDSALTELRKVSDATEERLTQNFKKSAETAKDLGASVSSVIEASADWSRMGYSVDESEELARISTLYVNVGDGIEMEDANNSLISTLQGFQMDVEEAESIVDRFNEVANNYAIDSAGIGEALQRSAASFNAANTDLSKSIALITATNEVVQNPDSVGKYICLPIQ